MKSYVLGSEIIKMSDKTKANNDLLAELFSKEKYNKEIAFIEKHYHTNPLNQSLFCIDLLCREYRLLRKEMIKLQKKLKSKKP